MTVFTTEKPDQWTPENQETQQSHTEDTDREVLAEIIAVLIERVAGGVIITARDIPENRALQHEVTDVTTIITTEAEMKLKNRH